MAVMNSDLHGRWFRSRLIPWVTGSPLDIDLNFLQSARHMAAPEVAEIAIVFTGTVTPVGGTAQGEDFAKLFSNVTIRDEAEMVNASGNSLRHLAMMELNSKYVDVADIGVGVATAVTYVLPIVFEPTPDRAIRPRDFRVPLVNFLEGGNMILQTCAAVPTNFGVAAGSWNIQVCFLVKDGRKREIKSRRRIWEQVLNVQDYEYQVNGAIRSAIITSNLTTTLYTDLSAYTTIYSRTLDLPPQFQTFYLRDTYRRQSTALASTDEFVSATPYAIPLVHPGRDKKIGTMIDSPVLHIDLLQAAPASGRLLLDAVVDRSPTMAALALGYSDPNELALAIQAKGVVVGEAGNMRASELPKSLARKMCIRV